MTKEDETPLKLSKSHSEILRLAVPLIISNISVPILSLFNIGVSGQMGQGRYVAAVVAASTMFNMFYWVLNFLRAGTSGLAAQAHGANNHHERTIILYRAIVMAVAISLLLIVFRSPLGNFMVKVFAVQPEDVDIVIRFFNICLLGAPAVLMTFAAMGWLVGSQSAMRPMWIALTVNALNVALTYVFVYMMKKDVEGIAFGSITAQWIGLVVALVLCRKKIDKGKVALSEVMHLKEFKHFFSVNADMFFRTLFLVAVTVWFNRVGYQQSRLVYAANSVLMNLYLTYTYAMDGFAHAGEALVGKYFGAKRPLRLSQTIRDNFKWNFMLVAIFSVVLSIWGVDFVGMLSNDARVAAIADDYVWWSVAMVVAGSVAFTWDGVYIGATASRAMLLTTFLSMLTFFALYYLLYPKMGNNGLWLAFVANLAVRSLVQTLLARRSVYARCDGNVQEYRNRLHTIRRFVQK
ncbi:MAG: MATE family efflux transporter [Muribaculaceae bacterium]|nr:MATE family efflux transporter [Muribaculaceae bacterium]